MSVSSKAVSVPMAAKQRAAAKALQPAEETLKRVPEHLDAPPKHGLGCPPKAATRLELVAQNVAAARHAPQRLTGQRALVTQSIRAIGHTYHFVDLECGVRRNGKLIAGDIQRHIDTIRTVAQQAQRSGWGAAWWAPPAPLSCCAPGTLG
jgi:hypothetical protein